MSAWVDCILQFGKIVSRVVRNASGEEVGRIVPHNGNWIAHTKDFKVVGICPTQELAVNALTK